MYVSSSITDDLDLWTHGVCIAFNTHLADTDGLYLETCELYVKHDCKHMLTRYTMHLEPMVPEGWLLSPCMYVSFSITDDLDLWTHGVCIAFNTLLAAKDDLYLETCELYVKHYCKHMHTRYPGTLNQRYLKASYRHLTCMSLPQSLMT